jgi:hypothetical protein
MSQAPVVTQDSRRPIDGSISRRALVAGSIGLVAAGLAMRGALAQGTPSPGMPAVQAPVRQGWLDKRHEEIIEPELPIIDPHHHLWDRPNYRYLFPELLADLGTGHNIRATCYEQAREMYRTSGPEELKSLGETEFVSGVAAMSESGKYGPTRCIAGIIGFVDLQLGSRAKGVLERHIAVSDGRLRGIRNGSTWSDDPALKTFTAGAPKGLLLDKNFREGFAALAPLRLPFADGCSKLSSTTLSILPRPSRRRRSFSIIAAARSQSAPILASAKRRSPSGATGFVKSPRFPIPMSSSAGSE